MKKLVVSVVGVLLVSLSLVGCSRGTDSPAATPEVAAPCETLHNEKTCIPTTKEEVQKIVHDRYADCFAALGESKTPIYAERKEGEFLPATILFGGEDWVVVIEAGEVTTYNDATTMITTPFTENDYATLERVGC